MGKWAEQSPERIRAYELMGETEAYSRYWGFNGGGAASDKAKNYLRSLLRTHAGNPDAEAIRALFNEKRADGELIDRQDVSAAIEALKKLAG